MPTSNISKSRHTGKYIYISPEYWPFSDPSGDLNIILPLGTILKCRYRTVNGHGQLTRHGLFDNGPQDGLPLPLQISDRVEYNWEGNHIRIINIIRGANTGTETKPDPSSAPNKTFLQSAEAFPKNPTDLSPSPNIQKNSEDLKNSEAHVHPNQQNAQQIIEKAYPGRLQRVTREADIRNEKGYMVYILMFNNRPIVLGMGKHNRARVIVDNLATLTANHIKAIHVRLYRLYGKGTFDSFIISCESREEAKDIENRLHLSVGGRDCKVPGDIEACLFEGLPPESNECLFLRLALLSSFSGISDLRRWRQHRILDDATWNTVDTRLGGI
jgi:hypothetical protein